MSDFRGLSFCVWVKGNAFEFEPKSLPVDAGGDLEGKKWKAQESPVESGRGQGFLLHVQMSGEQDLTFFPQNHVDVHFCAGSIKVPIVGDVHADKRGDVKLLLKCLFGSTFGILGICPVKRLGVAFLPWGVCDFSHDCERGLQVLVPAIVEGDWVEEVAEGSQVGDHGDPAFEVDSQLFVEGLLHCGFQRGYLGAVVIFTAEPGKVGPIGRPEPCSLKDPWQLIQKEVWHKQFVTEFVLLRGAAMVENLAKIQAAIHHKWAPKASQTRSPLVNPSS